MIDRIISIDILRGFALLGILIMNITSFAMPSMSYFSPLIYDVSLPNHIVYCISHVLADQKFMAIFSILFGASAILFINNCLKKGKNPFLLYYSRNFWLFIIGSLHSYYLWYGDILLIYSFCAFFLYFFKNISPQFQFILGVIIYLSPATINFLTYEYVIDHQSKVDQAVIIDHWNPSTLKINEEIEVYRGSYDGQIKYRDKMWSSAEKENSKGAIGKGIIGLSLLIDLLSRSFGMMLIGMSCFSWGIFNNTRSRLYYKNFIIYGFGIGFPLSIIGLFNTYSAEWNWKYVQFLARIPNHLATPFISFGYIGLLMLLIRSDFMSSILERLRAIGKTALSAYLMQTIIATSIFYGFGLGLFGYIDRTGQILIMILIWGLLLFICPLWLKRYQYGPIEWVWRMLTHIRFIHLTKISK